MPTGLVTTTSHQQLSPAPPLPSKPDMDLTPKGLNTTTSHSHGTRTSHSSVPVLSSRPGQSLPSGGGISCFWQPSSGASARLRVCWSLKLELLGLAQVGVEFGLAARAKSPLSATRPCARPGRAPPSSSRPGPFRARRSRSLRRGAGPRRAPRDSLCVLLRQRRRRQRYRRHHLLFGRGLDESISLIWILFPGTPFIFRM